MHTAVDEDLLHAVVTTVGVVKGLDDDAKSPHQHCGNNKEHESTINTRNKHVLREACMHLHLMQ